jgi:phospholipid-binding lipoprotein MlaA
MRRLHVTLTAALALAGAAAASAVMAADEVTGPAGVSGPAPLKAAPMAIAPVDYGVVVDDPFESANRKVYKFDRGLDRVVVRPLAMTYRRMLPKTVRKGVRNGLNNLNEPNTLMNDLLQGHPKAGGVTAARFVVNSTVGVLGLFDVAGHSLKLPIHYSDFGQTLGRYGVKPGPYLYTPVFGPSNFRDGLGRIVDAFTGILDIHDLHATTADRVGVAFVDGLDTRVEYDGALKDLNRMATDPYVTLRSLYSQQRAAKIGGEKPVQQLPDFDAPAGPGPQPGSQATPEPAPQPDAAPTAPLTQPL